MHDSRSAGGAATEPHPDVAEKYRPEFPIFREKRYLNSNSLGALSRRSLEARRTFEEQWNALGASAWYELWLGKLNEVRAAFGRTVGAGPDEVALMPNVSASLAAVAGALDFGDRPRVVVTELDFPTVVYQFLSRGRLGVETVIVESPDGVTVPLEAVEEAVDDRTALVATSHVFFSTGAVQDAAALAEVAHHHGALLFLDAYQSNGQLPVDVRGLDVDFLASGALKWLLGGPGLAFLYVRPELAGRLQPTTQGWFGVRDPFAFDPRSADPRPDARGFEMGTPAVGAAFTASGGLEIIEEIGIARIAERNRWLAADLAGRLRRAGFELRQAADPERRSALVLARHPDPPDAVARLAEREIIVDSRRGCVRFSPHFYNTVDDNRAAVRALRATLGEDG